MPVQTDSVLVVVLSQKRVAAAELHFAGGGLSISALGDVSVPEGVFDMGQFANGELLGRALSTFLTEKRIGARKAIMVLPEGTAVTQLMKLPVMPREDMLGAVRSVAERYAVFAEHEISADACVVEDLEDDGNPMSSVLFAAARVATIEQCQECARAAGLELLSVEAGAVAAVRAYRERFVPSDVVAMAVVGEVKTDVMIFDKGVLRLCYSANAGLPEETESGEWVTPLPEERDPFSAPPQLFSELSHCFRFFQNQFPGSAVGRVLVVADHPKADLMVAHLGTQLQVPVELGKPAYELHLPMEVDERAAAVTRAMSLAEFRGAALNVLSEGAPFLPINLLPTIRGARILTKPALTAVLVLMPLALLLALAWSVSLGSRIKSQNAEMDRTQAKIAALQPELDMLRAAQATEQALRNEVERETARIARERTVRWSQILVDISDRLPGGMWLTQSNSPDTTKITLTGIATSREIIPRAIESLAKSPYLANVRLGSLEKDDNYAPGREVVRYQIKSGLRRGMMIAPEQTAQPVMSQEETSQ